MLVFKLSQKQVLNVRLKDFLSTKINESKIYIVRFQEVYWNAHDKHNKIRNYNVHQLKAFTKDLINKAFLQGLIQVHIRLNKTQTSQLMAPFVYVLFFVPILDFGEMLKLGDAFLNCFNNLSLQKFPSYCKSMDVFILVL